jgi:hypothetical protein
MCTPFNRWVQTIGMYVVMKQALGHQTSVAGWTLLVQSVGVHMGKLHVHAHKGHKCPKYGTQPNDAMHADAKRCVA